MQSYVGRLLIRPSYVSAWTSRHASNQLCPWFVRLVHTHWHWLIPLKIKIYSCFKLVFLNVFLMWHSLIYIYIYNMCGIHNAYIIQDVYIYTTYPWACVGLHVNTLYACLLLFYPLASYMVISGQNLACDSAHSLRLHSAAPLGNQAIRTMTWYPTQSHYPDTEPHDLIPHSVTLSWHWANQSLQYSNNAKHLARKQ